MKNELLARAITEMDDKLITDAQMTPFAKRKYKKYLGFCAAACFVFVCGAVFLFGHIGRTEIFINGEPVSDQPIAVGM